ncbi:MAG TPA: hypothetical protein DIU00_24145 [Phycisphaerales bacterium]|nr:hypothetical protein [Phycisphaerales bacterium]
MNANLLTIDNMLTGITGTYSGPSKPDATRQGTKFHLSPDDKQPQINSRETPTTYNINHEADKKTDSKSPQELPKAIRKKIDSEHPCEARNGTKSKEQNAASGKAEQQEVVQSGLAEQPAAAEQNKEGSPAKIEMKVGSRLAQLIANFKTNKSSQVTGQAAKSAEIKLLHAPEKDQSGLKTVLPATSGDQNGLKAVLPGTTKNATAGKTQPGTVNNTEKILVSPKTVDDAKAVTKTKELASEIPSNTGSKISTATGKTAAANPGFQAVQPKVTETQPQSAGIDPKKAVLPAESDTRATASQTLSNLLNTNGKESTHAELPENPTIQKLNMAAVQVAAGQTKGRDASTSNKSPSHGLEQILSHNNSQTQITEQPSASAKNASNTNMPAQNSSGDVSADIGKQILESIHRSLSQEGADRQITLRLNPPELGKVFIRFQQQDSELTGLLEVSKTQTRFEIEQTLPQIIHNLADCGIQIRRLDVTLSNEEQPGQGTFGNQSLQSGGAQQQYSANQGTPGNNPDENQSNEWWASNNGYENLSELQDALITDGSINLLI